MTTSPPEATKRSWLDVIENIGNKVPHPAIIFLGLCVLVIVLSAILAAFDVKVTYEVAEPPTVSVTQDPLPAIVVLITWLLFFIAWFVLGIPMGPGYPASL